MIKKSILFSLGIALFAWLALASLWGYPLFYYSILTHKFFPEYRHRQVTLNILHKGEPVTIRFVARCRQVPSFMLSMWMNYHKFFKKARLEEMLLRWRYGYPTQAFAHIDNPIAYTGDGTLLLADFVPWNSKICSDQSGNDKRVGFVFAAYPNPHDVKGWEVFPRMTCGDASPLETRCVSARIEDVSPSAYGVRDAFEKKRPDAYPKPDHKVAFWKKGIVVLDLKGIPPDALENVEDKKGVVRFAAKPASYRAPKRFHYRLENRNGKCLIGHKYHPYRDGSQAVREDLMCSIETRNGLLKPRDLAVREWIHLPGEPARLARFSFAGLYPRLPWQPIHRQTGFPIFGFMIKYLDTD